MNNIDPCKPGENGIAKCQNNGTCSRDGINGHTCDCSSTDFYGASCEIGNMLYIIQRHF